ncbi:hypothetical protein NECAME_06812 [Necator americanus]|uniref:Uncharacterized protein n=1 Tax=Necator americanus TaxID=51031 RepID=W2TTZ7_NECAM|nr:hypothetical protein NECAME_06812 [Necator americanus]ETN84576.1 hypothetical protein NECAME_06812 [Necator americanus]
MSLCELKYFQAAFLLKQLKCFYAKSRKCQLLHQGIEFALLFIFIDEDFKRPFFTAYVKTCMLTVYIVRYIAFEKSQQHLYNVLENDVSDCESVDIGRHHSLAAFDCTSEKRSEILYEATNLGDYRTIHNSSLGSPPTDV